MRWRFLARRLAMLLASLLIASFVIFGALYLAPGNPISALSGGRALPPAARTCWSSRYHLNQPFLAQYWYWLDNALHGNLGLSITLQENVSSLIGGAHLDDRRARPVRGADHPGLRHRAGVLAGAAARLADTSMLVSTAVSAAVPSFVAAIVLVAGVLGQARLVPGARQRRGLRSTRAALHAASDRAGGLLAGDRRAGDPRGGARGGRARARADGDQPRHPAAPAHPPAHPAQRRDPDHDRLRHHHRLADRGRRRRRDRVQPQRPRRVPGPGRRSRRTSRWCRASRWCSSPRSS